MEFASRIEPLPPGCSTIDNEVYEQPDVAAAFDEAPCPPYVARTHAAAAAGPAPSAARFVCTIAARSSSGSKKRGSRIRKTKRGS